MTSTPPARAAGAVPRAPALQVASRRDSGRRVLRDLYLGTNCRSVTAVRVAGAATPAPAVRTAANTSCVI